MNHYKQILIASTLAALFIASVGVAAAEPVKLTVHVDRPGIVISPMLYGLMTEEISHSYDGGLYAELIRNRSFQDNSAIPEHWTLIQKDGGAGEIALDTSMPLNASIRTSLKLTATTASPTRQVGVANDGWWGIPVKPRTTYKSSFYAKANSSDHGPLTIAIENADGTHVFAKARVNGITGMWQKYTTTLTTGEVAPSTSNRFVIYTDAPGTVWLSVVSLFPPTYHNRVNGNRIDLMERLAAMKPAFLRFPGGNYMEGNTISERFEWKDTIGDISARVGHQSSWGYPSSNGMGLLEFLTWCEDLHISPILAVFAGYSLQGEHIVPGHALEPYVQDALDEIEYVTGDSNTKWGARRIADGHPKPFALEYVEVGNEDFFDRSKSYDGRFAQFRDALKARYPSIKLIATMPVTSRIPDMIDDHFYRPATAMEADADHYAHDDRKGPQVFVGEWASILPDISPWSKEALSISPTPNFG